MWIQSHQEIADHPKTKRVMRLLGLSRPETIGYLHLLWWWALDHADDGDLGRYEDADIEDAVGWTGEPGAFVGALCRAGYLDGCSDNLSIHDWAEYGGKIQKKNRQAVQRVRNMRERNADVTRNTRVTSDDATRNTPNVTPLDIEVDIDTDTSILGVGVSSTRASAEETAAAPFTDLSVSSSQAIRWESEQRWLRLFEDRTADWVRNNQRASDWLFELVGRYGEERALSDEVLTYAAVNKSRHGGALKAMSFYLGSQTNGNGRAPVAGYDIKTEIIEL